MNKSKRKHKEIPEQITIPIPNDTKQAICLKQAREFALTVIKECEQRNYTMAQFNEFVEFLDKRRQYMNSHINEFARMKDGNDY